MEFYQQLIELLKQNPKYLDANGDLIKQKVINAAEKTDHVSRFSKIGAPHKFPS